MKAAVSHKYVLTLTYQSVKCDTLSTVFLAILGFSEADSLITLLFPDIYVFNFLQAKVIVKRYWLAISLLPVQTVDFLFVRIFELLA